VSDHRRVRPVHADERDWLVAHLQLSWGGATIVSRGRMRDVSQLPALVCTHGDDLLGLATYDTAGEECELVTIEAFRRHEGVGTALLEAVIAEARKHGSARLCLVTTNDNLTAQRFYERHGLRLVAVQVGAVDVARKLKPEIPLVGEDGIEIHDEWEYELRLE
jgi:GNAT superfamily N-acetyltransferase